MLNHKNAIKITIIVTLSSLVIFLVWYLNKITIKHFENNHKINKLIDTIYHKEIHVNYSIIQSVILKKESIDLIKKNEQNLIDSINILQKNKILITKYSLTELIKEYEQRIKQKIELINKLIPIYYKIEAQNRNLKRYLDLIPKLKKENKISIKYGKSILKTINNINNLKILEKEIKYLSHMKFQDIKISNLNNKIIKDFTKYVALRIEFESLLKSILNDKDFEILNKINNHIQKLTIDDEKNIDLSLRIVILTIIIYSIFTIALLLNLDKKNQSLTKTLERIEYINKIDHLTNIYSRLKFNTDIQNLKDGYVLYILNINKFSLINNVYGIEIGDKILKEVAKRLQKFATNQEKIYRIGSDEFAIIKKKENDSCKLFAISILELFKKDKIIIEDIKFEISFHIGISCIPPYFENALMALNEAKKSNKEKIIIYSDIIDQRQLIKENIQKAQTLINAFNEYRIVTAYQPISNRDKKIVKYEVLARIFHKDGRVESIYPYLDIVKDNKLYFELTKRVIDKAFQYFENKEVEFSINFSIEDINNPNIVEYLIKKLTPDIAKRLTIEILESENVEDYENIQKFIDLMHKLHVSVAIDDFGSGYSNFIHLINLNIDLIKIDGSLIKNIKNNSKLYNIVYLMTQFAKNNNQKVIAEFVEDEETFQILKEIGIDYMQGYYIGRPKLQL